MIDYKRNVLDVVSNSLKNRKIKFSLDDEDGTGCVSTFLFELIFINVLGYIQVEFSDDKVNIVPAIQYFTQNNEYHEVEMNISNLDEIDNQIEEFVLFIKSFNKAIIRIQNKIEQITNLCEDLQMDPDIFITVNYDFED